MAALSKKGLNDKDNITAAFSLNSLSSAIRFTGYLFELGIEPTINEETNEVIVKARAKEIDLINFALYLTEQWVENASIQSADQ
jgi:hypothetical protein